MICKQKKTDKSLFKFHAFIPFNEAKFENSYSPF